MTVECILRKLDATLAVGDRYLPVVIFSLILPFLPYTARQLSLQWRAVQAFDKQFDPAMKIKPQITSASSGMKKPFICLLLGIILLFVSFEFDDGRRLFLVILYKIPAFTLLLLSIIAKAEAISTNLCIATSRFKLFVTRTVLSIETEKSGSSKAYVTVRLLHLPTSATAQTWSYCVVIAPLTSFVLLCYALAEEHLTMLACATAYTLGGVALSNLSPPTVRGVSLTTGQVSLGGWAIFAGACLSSAPLSLIQEITGSVVDEESTYHARQPGQGYFDALMANELMLQLFALSQIFLWVFMATIPLEFCAFVYRFELWRSEKKAHEELEEATSSKEEEISTRAVEETETLYGNLMKGTKLQEWYGAAPITLSAPSLSTYKPPSARTPVYRATTYAIYLVYLLMVSQYLFHLGPLLHTKDALLRPPLFPKEGQIVMRFNYFPSALTLCPAVCFCVALLASAWCYGGMRGIREIWAYQEPWNLILPVEDSNTETVAPASVGDEDQVEKNLALEHEDEERAALLL